MLGRHWHALVFSPQTKIRTGALTLFVSLTKPFRSHDGRQLSNVLPIDTVPAYRRRMSFVGMSFGPNVGSPLIEFNSTLISLEMEWAKMF